jgi:hypothetical protein
MPSLDQQFMNELAKLTFDIGDAGESVTVTITPTGGVPIFTTPQPNAVQGEAAQQNPQPGQSMPNQDIRNRLNGVGEGGTIILQVSTTVTVKKKI